MYSQAHARAPGYSEAEFEALQPDLTVIRVADEDVPARRLLAHDLEPLLWDPDGDGPVPPPD